MAEQATDTVDDSGAVTGTDTAGALAHGTAHSGHNPGRPISWVGTTVVIIGFIIGGVGFIPTPNWIVFWIGTAVAIVGCLILLFSKAMSTDWY